MDVHRLLSGAAQLAAGLVVLAVIERDDTGAPVSARLWLGAARGAGRLAEVAGRVSIAAEARYYRQVTPYG